MKALRASTEWCGRVGSRLVPYPDSTFAYSTARSLTIKDWRLGFMTLVLKFGIFCYIIIYQVIFQQVYRRDSAISVSLRTRTLSGAAEYAWTNGNAPYCLGVTAHQHPSQALVDQYVIVDADNYQYIGPGGGTRGGNTFIFPRRNCLFLDEGDAVPLLESDRSFLLTETRVTPQTWTLTNPSCANGTAPCVPCPTPFLNASACSYNPDNDNNGEVEFSNTTRSYIPNMEFFTINVDHSFVAPQANGLTRTSLQMAGNLLDQGGNKMNPCIGYTSLGLPCPSVVRVGVRNEVDIFPLRTLMLAAGVQSLDQLNGRFSNRQQGLVLILDISYTNYALGNIPPVVEGGPTLGGVGYPYLFTDNEVQYTYRVFTVPNTQFQFQSAASNLYSIGETPSTAAAVRYFRRNYGVRLLITYGGRIGSYFFQTLLVNLVAGLALLGVSATVMEFIVFSVCPLRGLYKQLKERETVSITELREAGKKNPEEYASLIETYNSATTSNIDGHPEQVLKVLGGVAGTEKGKAVAVENVLHSASPSTATQQWASTEKK